MKTITINNETINLNFKNLSDTNIQRAALQQLIANGEQWMAFTDVDGVNHAILNDVTGATEDEAMKQFTFHSGAFNEASDFCVSIQEWIDGMPVDTFIIVDNSNSEGMRYIADGGGTTGDMLTAMHFTTEAEAQSYIDSCEWNEWAGVMSFEK